MSKKSPISNLEILSIKGPWATKSNGELDLISALDFNAMNDFFNYDSDELEKISQDIRGLRLYRVSNLQKGAVGGVEWHRIKKELIVVTKGSVRWELKDRSGNTEKLTLTPKNLAIIIPPFTMHTYTALEDDSEIFVITNTLYDPSEPLTHDTYLAETFPPR